jgi:hypothetical protein
VNGDSVQDSPFDRFGDGFKHRVQFIVRQHLDIAYRLRAGRLVIAGRKRQEEVATTVMANAGGADKLIFTDFSLPLSGHYHGRRMPRSPTCSKMNACQKRSFFLVAID